MITYFLLVFLFVSQLRHEVKTDDPYDQRYQGKRFAYHAGDRKNEVIIDQPAPCCYQNNASYHGGVLFAIGKGGQYLCDDDQYAFLALAEEYPQNQNIMLNAAVEIVVFLLLATCLVNTVFRTHLTRFMIITNSVNALLMTSKSKIPCILIGGNYCDRDMCFTGTIAEQYTRQFNVDVAFFSCLGLSKDGVISDHDVEQSTIRKIMLGRSKKNIFCSREAS